MKQCKIYIFRFSPIIAFVVILIVIHLFSKNSLTTEQLIAAIASSLITAVGWFFSLYLNHTTFQRGEIIKNKDKLVSLVEEFFEELIDLLEKRKTTESDVENLITVKVAEIELKNQQIKRVFKKDVMFLSDRMIADLSSSPIDIFQRDYNDAKSQLFQLKKQVLSDIDTKYETWLGEL